MMPSENSASTIRVLIVDDEPLAQMLISNLVATDPDLVSVGVCSDGIQARREILQQEPDLVFLDVQMPKLNGVELVEGLDDRQCVPYVVFVTAFSEYAVQAFDVDALDFLMKPVDEERFNVAVARAKNAIQQKRLRKLSEQIANVATSYKQHIQPEDATQLIVKKGDELIRLPASDIVWLEAASQYVRVHTRDNTYLIAETMKNYQRRLPQHMFTRIHRSTVVNRTRLSRVFKKPNGVHALELDDGTVLSLARSRRKLLNDLLEDCPPESSTAGRISHG
jgi:two-component system LytT family response regulator